MIDRAHVVMRTMPLPDFTSDEQYLINSIRSPKASSNSSSYMWGYVIGGALIAVFAAYYENVLMMLAAFVVVCGFRVYEEHFQLKWMPLWRSIIEKYEAAAISSDKPVATDADQHARGQR
jgi:hypothetical protein